MWRLREDTKIKFFSFVQGLSGTDVLSFTVHSSANLPTLSNFIPIYSFTSRDAVFKNSAILKLFRLCSPSTISRLVITIAIYTVKSFIFRSLTHILYETRKRYTPSFTNSNTPITVQGVADMIFIVTALLHATPRIVFGASRHVMFGVTHIRSIAKCGVYI